MMDKQTILINQATASDDGKRLWSVITEFLKTYDKGVKVTVEENAETRRLKQNKLLWLWNAEISKHVFQTQGTIFSSEDIHEFIARKLLPVRVVNIKGEKVTVRSETKNLTVNQFSEYLNNLEYYATEQLGATLTHPDDLYFDALMRDE